MEMKGVIVWMDAICNAENRLITRTEGGHTIFKEDQLEKFEPW